MTKFEIIKESYEKEFTIQKYEHSNCRHTYGTLIEAAMDEYAKQQVIGFAGWVAKSEEWDFNGCGGYHNLIAKNDISPAELYNKFLTETSI